MSPIGFAKHLLRYCGIGLTRSCSIDQERHKQKIREAIKKNLADIVSEESIILSDGKKVIKVPIRLLEEMSHLRCLLRADLVMQRAEGLAVGRADDVGHDVFLVRHLGLNPRIDVHVVKQDEMLPALAKSLHGFVLNAEAKDVPSD
jgi:Protein of unknown function (DUF444)